MERPKPLNRDILSDRFLLAYLIYKADQRDLGKTKIQKLVYFIESELAEDNIKTFDYDFVKGKHGPYAKKINDDLTQLTACNVLIDKPYYTPFGTQHHFEITNDGQEIIEESYELIDENIAVVNAIDKIIQKYAPRPLNEILDIVYNKKVEVNGKLVKIQKVHMGTELNVGVPDADSKNRLKMDDDWKETFCILFDKDCHKSHIEGLKDAQAGRFSTYETA